ncbi:MAG: SPFH domain-containing protein [Candidatus Parabeggiatoa sp.]|nr:SPFH domain-containing protein [Candidatus Parabeggiatoa sp.]
MQIDWMIFTSIFFALSCIIGFILLLLYLGIHFVSQGMQYTVERVGKYTRTLQSGVRFVLPFFEQISNRIDMREQVMDVPRQEVITKDNAMITVDGVVFYRIFDAEKATYQVTNLNEALMQLTTTNIRTVMGSMDLDDLLSKRDDINEKLFEVVDEATDPWGVKIVRIEIKDITPPTDLVQSMGRQMKAERDKRAAILEAEGLKKAAVEKAEGEKRALILKAEGQKEAEILKAQGYKESEILKAEAQKEINLLEAETRKEAAEHDAYARERIAVAEAKATSLVSEAIINGDIQAINYFIALKYVDALQNIASAENQKLIMMPLEASSLISSVAGISDIAKEILIKKENDRPSKSRNQVVEEERDQDEKVDEPKLENVIKPKFEEKLEIVDKF